MKSSESDVTWLLTRVMSTLFGSSTTVGKALKLNSPALAPAMGAPVISTTHLSQKEITVHWHAGVATPLVVRLNLASFSWFLQVTHQNHRKTKFSLLSFCFTRKWEVPSYRQEERSLEALKNGDRNTIKPQ